LVGVLNAQTKHHRSECAILVGTFWLRKFP
jgi:hypothetical protein